MINYDITCYWSISEMPVLQNLFVFITVLLQCIYIDILVDERNELGSMVGSGCFRKLIGNQLQPCSLLMTDLVLADDQNSGLLCGPPDPSWCRWWAMVQAKRQGVGRGRAFEGGGGGKQAGSHSWCAWGWKLPSTLPSWQRGDHEMLSLLTDAHLMKEGGKPRPGGGREMGHGAASHHGQPRSCPCWWREDWAFHSKKKKKKSLDI